MADADVRGRAEDLFTSPGQFPYPDLLVRLVVGTDGKGDESAVG